MPKDWTGNRKTTFVTLGASNHSNHDRAENDYYATEPKAIDFLLEVENLMVRFGKIAAAKVIYQNE